MKAIQRMIDHAGLRYFDDALRLKEVIKWLEATSTDACETPAETQLLRRLKELEELAGSAVEAHHLHMALADVEQFLKGPNPECENCHHEMMRGKPDYDYYCAYCQLGFDYANVEVGGKLTLKLVPNVY